MDWKDNINNVREIFQGHYQIILDFASNDFLPYVLNPDFKYVWVINYSNRETQSWRTLDLPLNHSDYCNVLARNLKYDFIVPSGDFLQLLPNLGPGIRLLQINKIPPYYLDPGKITSKTLYDLFIKECDYLFEINLPSATDYGTIISSNKEWLQSLLENKKIDWNNLP